MSDLYNKTLKNDVRYSEAHRHASKVGGAYTGWRPRPSLPAWIADTLVVVIALALVVFAIVGLGL